MPTTRDSHPVITFASRAKWKAWLAKHHATAPGVWMQIAKPAASTPSVSYADAIEVALCYGWIDGQKAAHDAHSWLQRFTPRTPRSRWSKINREKATDLIARGEMQAAGRREVEAAQADGRWEAAYAGQATMAVPDDLRAALARNARARTFFETLDRTNRYAILYRIHDAKRPATRQARVEKFVTMLAAHETIHPTAGAHRKTRAKTRKSGAGS